MFEDIPKTLGKSFIISSFFSGLIFVTFNVVFLLPLLRSLGTPYISSWYALSLGHKISFVLLLACIVGSFISSINTPLIRFYEGYYPFQKKYLLNMFLKKQLKRFNEIRNTISQNNHSDDSKREKRIELFYSFPPIEERVMPTRLGNIFAAFEWYPKMRYGIDPVAFWPRLISIIPEGYYKDIENAKISFDFLINTSFFMFIFGIESIIFAYILSAQQCFLALKNCLLFGFEDTSALLFLPFLDCWIASIKINTILWYVVAAIVAFILTYSLYSFATSAATSLGEVIKSCFDLYRRDLLVKLGITPPKTLIEEKRLWKGLSKFIIYNEPVEIPFKETESGNTVKQEK